MVSRQVVPEPPVPFDAAELTLVPGHRMFRVHSNRFEPNQFNPGFGAPTRFAFFGVPTVPVLYAAETEDAAICETILHDVPMAGGAVVPAQYVEKVASSITVNRPLRLARLHGTGLRRLGVEAEQVTSTTAKHYPRTVLWAEASYTAGFDGVAYMSKRCNSDEAYVFFGDRCDGAFDIAPGYGRVFADPSDFAWLSDFCAPLHVDVYAR